MLGSKTTRGAAERAAWIATHRRTADKLDALARAIRSLHPENMNARDFAEMRRDFLTQIDGHRDLILALADLWGADHECDHP